MSSPAETKIGFLTSSTSSEAQKKVVQSGTFKEYSVDYQVVSVPAVPWLDPAEKCRGEMEEARKSGLFADKEFIVNGGTVISIEESGPLLSRRFVQERAQEYFDQLCLRLIGRGDKKVLHGEILSGVAVYDQTRKTGFLVDTPVPFSFSPLASENEVGLYLRILSRISNVEIAIDREFQRQIRETQGSSINFERAAGEMALSINWFDPSERESNSLKLTDEETEGLFISQEYPGGVYLAPLVAMGKVRKINGIPVNEMEAEELGKYISISRDCDGETILALLNALKAKEQPFEIFYKNQDWTKVYIWGRKETYPLYLFFQWEQNQLNRPLKDIWKDDNLPAKIRRQLLLQKLGIEINPHLHIPKEVFFKDAERILPELWDMWQTSVGVSSACFNESPLAKTPSTKFSLRSGKKEIQATINKFKRALEEKTLAKLSPPDQRDFVIVYPAVWEEKKLIVGGVCRFDTPPQISGEQDTTDWGMEMQKGRYPRIIEKSAGSYIRLEHQPAKQIVPGLTDPTQSSFTERIVSGDEVANDEFLLMVEQEAQRFVKSYEVKVAVRTLMELTGQRPLALEWYYFKPTGAILAFDFHGATPKSSPFT